MPNHLSAFGIIHTVISIIALLAAFYALLRDGKISPKKLAGKLYIILTVLACLTSFLVMKTGHLTGAHGLSVLILVLLPIAVYAPAANVFGKKAAYVQTVGMSATLFFSMIPAVVETLTRLPISQPLAANPASPVVKAGLLILIVLFTAGIIYQVSKLKKIRKMFPNAVEMS